MSLALLGADRSLSISEVLATVRPLASYIAARNWAVAGAADLTNRSTIRWTLHQMVASGVVSVYDAGTEAVWGIGEDQHLVAAFYRNTAIHILVDRGPSPSWRCWRPQRPQQTARFPRRPCVMRR